MADILSFPRPSPEEMEGALRVLEPWRKLTSPVFIGRENIPEVRPLLFVGNHSTYGLFDAPLFIAELYRSHKIFLRSLSDHFHFKVPVWREFLTRYGAVDGTRENCSRLMEAGETVLVFPGGAREVTKRKGEAYKLMWKDRLGFVRLAIQHACTIVPFAAIGIDDAYDILLDGDDLMSSPFGKVLKRLGVRTDAVLPLARGVGPTPFPRVERIYFAVAPAIATDCYERDYENVERCRALRDRVRTAVESGISDLLKRRSEDPDRAMLPRVVRELTLGSRKSK